MPLPQLTPEVRAEALAKAISVRKERGALLKALKSGSLSLPALLERDDEVIAKTYVRRVLESLPGVGRVRARELLIELGIAETRRVQGLGPRQRERLCQQFPPSD
ncbi:integration host factor, actinobacterial type [Streptomyces sp. NPDC059215]|uniref:integration host factor, actinobacterial type n=1 Tax=Streptomyces sp. NPDC059215 TaxID=3346772 RepID=UPI0036B2BBF3